MTHGNGDHAAAAANGYPAKPHSSEPSPPSFHDVCNELRQRVDAFLAEDQKTEVLRNVQAQLRVSMAVVEEALARYRCVRPVPCRPFLLEYGWMDGSLMRHNSLEQISISYNGGKDCLVLLIMLLACLARRYPSPSKPSQTNDSNGTTSFPDKFQAVYIVSKHPFAEVDDFVEATSSQYYLDVKRYLMSMKEGLGAYLEDRPNVKAIFVGTRRTDPHGEKLTHFDPTDSGWPDFMRVHPVIDWHYAEIWAGYTSLGGTQDTHPNPQLKKEGESGASFRPAYELTEDDEERLGRDR
ncbi:phosphoadenosine phosphosulfate reductase [Colletotrichum higginsianum IMI 349063]|uniref:FAD synthase n=1 Tax=Colletotrichum higginsianum (strain IMI 349063) TaxID=759273 RepID=A0A1B7Y4D7_COLHI|nr:phosphoadenosine phosphosulfate reductase [Colletotrichum higginsianum IMI 349063]OBR06826.1 phosphoadenosine phosphosulfate reductase [Colletotrichum higginsianum IMI 349063]GJD04709.1 phosphoadenosine phosphosulfate reductase [Colletotrichum higginsianum]